MKIIRSHAFRAPTAWGAIDIARVNGKVLRHNGSWQSAETGR